MIPDVIRSLVCRSFVLYAAVIAIFCVSTDFKKASHQRTRYLLGVFYNQSLDDYRDGIVYFDYLSRKRPDDGRNYFFLGYCYLYLGQYDTALIHFEKALRLLPGDGLILRYLAHTKSRLSKDGPQVPLPADKIQIPME